MPKDKFRGDTLTFAQFQASNQHRCRLKFKSCESWSLNDWGVALAGEVGEMCNILKKVRRGDMKIARTSHVSADPELVLAQEVRQQVLAELADVITYADLLMSELGADSGTELLRKFDEVSLRVGYRMISAKGRAARNDV